VIVLSNARRKGKQPGLTNQSDREEGERIRSWIRSTEGQAALAEGLERARKMVDTYREAQRVSQESLLEPVTGYP